MVAEAGFFIALPGRIVASYRLRLLGSVEKAKPIIAQAKRRFKRFSFWMKFCFCLCRLKKIENRLKKVEKLLTFAEKGCIM